MAKIRSTRVLKTGQKKTFHLKVFSGFPLVQFRSNGFSSGYKSRTDVASDFDNSINSSRIRHDGSSRVRSR